MKRTVTLPDDVVEELERYLAQQEVTLEDVLIAALKEYLQREVFGGRDYKPPTHPFRIDPIDVDARGETDVSINHDKYLGKP